MIARTSTLVRSGRRLRISAARPATQRRRRRRAVEARRSSRRRRSRRRRAGRSSGSPGTARRRRRPARSEAPHQFSLEESPIALALVAAVAAADARSCGCRCPGSATPGLSSLPVAATSTRPRSWAYWRASRMIVEVPEVPRRVDAEAHAHDARAVVGGEVQALGDVHVRPRRGGDRHHARAAGDAGDALARCRAGRATMPGAGGAVVAGRAAVGRVGRRVPGLRVQIEVRMAELDALVEHRHGDRRVCRGRSPRRAAPRRAACPTRPRTCGSFGVNAAGRRAAAAAGRRREVRDVLEPRAGDVGGHVVRRALRGAAGLLDHERGKPRQPAGPPAVDRHACGERRGLDRRLRDIEAGRVDRVHLPFVLVVARRPVAGAHPLHEVALLQPGERRRRGLRREPTTGLRCGSPRAPGDRPP